MCKENADHRALYDRCTFTMGRPFLSSHQHAHDMQFNLQLGSGTHMFRKKMFNKNYA